MPMLNSYSACCGASIITGFSSGNPASVGAYKPTSDGMKYELDAEGNKIPITLEDQFHATIAKRKAQYPNHMYQCVLTAEQYNLYDKGWPKVLKKAGFELTRRWTNSVHNNREFLYLFVLCTDEKGTCKGDFTQPPKGWDELPGPPPTTLEKVWTGLKELAA